MNRLFVDVREPHEFANDHVDGAINLPVSQVLSGAEVLLDVPRDTELVLYCISGSRSNSLTFYMKQLGFTNIVNGINKEQVKQKYGL
mgnify:CR=1 FL=1